MRATENAIESATPTSESFLSGFIPNILRLSFTMLSADKSELPARFVGGGALNRGVGCLGGGLRGGLTRGF